MAAEIKGNLVKVKSNLQSREDNNKISMKKSIDTSSGKNKILTNSKHKFGSTQSKSEVKQKTIASTSKTVTKTAAVKGKTEKKVYTLPGQRYDPPEEREPLRIFYESLSKQIPSSEMAEFWMMEHGLLSLERAKKAYERKQKRQQQLRMGTPIKSPQKDRPESSQRQHSSKNGDLKPKKRMSYSDDDDEVILKPKKREKIS